MVMAMVAVRVARSTLPLALCLAMARLTTRGLMRSRLPGVRLAGTSRPIVPAGSAAGPAGTPAAGMAWSRAAFRRPSRSCASSMWASPRRTAACRPSSGSSARSWPGSSSARSTRCSRERPAAGCLWPAPGATSVAFGAAWLARESTALNLWPPITGRRFSADRVRAPRPRRPRAWTGVGGGGRVPGLDGQGRGGLGG
jgi:hypothetical protein